MVHGGIIRKFLCSLLTIVMTCSAMSVQSFVRSMQFTKKKVLVTVQMFNRQVTCHVEHHCQAIIPLNYVSTSIRDHQHALVKAQGQILSVIHSCNAVEHAAPDFSQDAL